MTGSTVSSSELPFGEDTRVLNSAEPGMSPVAESLSPLRTSFLRSWALEPPIGSLVSQGPERKQQTKACLLTGEAVCCGRRNTDIGG